MWAYSSILCYCLLGLMAITFEMSSAKEKPLLADDNIKKQIQDTRILLKQVNDSLIVIGNKIKLLRGDMGVQYVKVDLTLLALLEQLPEYKYYQNKSSCLSPEEKTHLDNVISGFQHKAVNCVQSNAKLGLLYPTHLKNLSIEVQAAIDTIAVVESSCLILSQNDNEALTCLAVLAIDMEALALAWDVFVNLSFDDYYKYKVRNNALAEDCLNTTIYSYPQSEKIPAVQFKAEAKYILRNCFSP